MGPKTNLHHYRVSDTPVIYPNPQDMTVDVHFLTHDLEAIVLSMHPRTLEALREGIDAALAHMPGPTGRPRV